MAKCDKNIKNAHAHRCAHTHVHTHSHAHTNTHVHTHTRTHVHTHARMCTHTHRINTFIKDIFLLFLPEVDKINCP